MKFLILENIRGAYNVGAIFRTADGAGVNKILLVGYTPTPTDRFGRMQKEIAKTSLGAAGEIPWEHFSNVANAIQQTKDQDATVVAVEQTPESVSLFGFNEPANVAYIIGNEIDGVSDAALEQADTVLEIPMLGTKESLNLSVATGVVLYHGLSSK